LVEPEAQRYAAPVPSTSQKIIPLTMVACDTLYQFVAAPHYCIMSFLKMCCICYLFERMRLRISGLHAISGLAVSGIEMFIISGLALSVFKKKISG
jgi:hypothetical protein